MMKSEEIQPEVTAAWAREQIENWKSETIKNELNRILSSIAKFVRANRKNLLVKDLNPINQQELERRGFEVSYETDENGDYDHYTIKWGQDK